MDHTTETNLFGTEKIWKILLRLTPPVMFAQLIQALYNIVDSYFVGKYSPDGRLHSPSFFRCGSPRTWLVL